MDEEDIDKTYENLVRKTYNFDFNLKTEQLSIIKSILNGNDTFGVLPTGFGKSMCYVLPPLILDEEVFIDENGTYNTLRYLQLDWTTKHTSLVVSPLKSLMKDQTVILLSMGVMATSINVDMTGETMKDIKDGKFSVLFVSPEAILKPGWRNMLLDRTYKEQLCLLCFDEAHCITEWGEDFRPDYKRVNILRSFVDAPVLCLTATCTEKMRTVIFKSLELQDDTKKIAVVPNRPNIFLDISKCKDDEEILQWLETVMKEKLEKTDKVIIYCRSISSTSEIYCRFMESLCSSGMSPSIDNRIVEMFHKNIDEDSNRRILQEFCKPTSRIRLLISTIAFGMGVQIPDVRVVIHWGAPKSLLSYWQEVGRAGRDGKPALAICYAYGRSLDRRRTEEEVKELVDTVSSQCIRYSVLNQLIVEGMDIHILQNINKKNKCNRKCADTCKCANCICCSVCFQQCECPKRKSKYSLNFGYDF